MKHPANFFRALRLPFIAASILPFVFGSLIEGEIYSLLLFCLGLATVIFTHLSANLINDYADSKSGNDWIDKKFYKFFGGSKLIQEGVFSEGFYFWTAFFFAFCAFINVLLLALILGNLGLIVLYLALIILSWQYSQRPLQLSYHRLGEIVIFLLFGPALVMGGYYLQTSIFPDLKSFMLALPAGLLTVAILFANEVPDFSEDQKSSKFTGVSFFGLKLAFLGYLFLVFAALGSIVLGILLGYLSPLAYFSLIFVPLVFKAAMILKQHPKNKDRLIVSSKITIALQTVINLVLILSVVL